MNKQEIEDKINTIVKQIDSLKREKSDLEQDLINLAESFEDKFRIWWYSDENEEPEDWVPSEDKYPTLMKYFDMREPDRYRIYILADELRDQLNPILCPNEYEEGKEKYSSWNSRIAGSDKEAYKFYLKIAKELYEGKLKAFKYDW